jgi:hypothetical protein
VIKRHAYFLRANERRVAALKKPHFVKLSAAAGLEPVPWTTAATNRELPSLVWAKLTEDGHGFVLFREGTDEGPYHLPAYVDQQSEVKRLLLAPAAAVVDVTVVAAILGAVAAYAYAHDQSGR